MYEITKEELVIFKKLVRDRKEELGALNFEASRKEIAELREIAPLNYKLTELCKN